MLDQNTDTGVELTKLVFFSIEKKAVLRNANPDKKHQQLKLIRTFFLELRITDVNITKKKFFESVSTSAA